MYRGVELASIENKVDSWHSNIPYSTQKLSTDDFTLEDMISKR